MRYTTYAASALSALVLSATAAHAGDTQIITGVEGGGDNNSYAFASAVKALPGSTLGNGFVGRVTMERLTYRYKTGGTSIDATAAGGEVALGYQQSASTHWWGAYVGALYRNTDLSPNDPTSEVEGAHMRVRLGLEGETQLTNRIKANVITSYTAGAEAYWVRGRLLGRITEDSNIFVGPEVILQGDNDYRASQVGLAVTGFKPTENAELSLKAGARKTEDEDTTPYAGIELSFTL